MRRKIVGKSVPKKRPEVDAFLKEIKRVMRKHRMCLHQPRATDCLFEVGPYFPDLVEGMMSAQVSAELREISFAPKRDPELRFDFYLSDIGYEAELYVNGEDAGGQCRDFGGSLTKKTMATAIEDLYQRIIKQIDEWRKKY